MRVLAAAALLLLLAGCASPTRPGEPSPSIAPGDLEAEPDLELHECSAWKAAMSFLGGTGPGEPPAGWSPAGQDRLSTRVGMSGLQCARTAVGPRGHGPALLVLDTHDNVEVPERCAEGNGGGFVNPGVLSLFLTDNAGLAADLDATFGLPATVGVLRADEVDGPVRLHTWTWAVPGFPESRLSIVADDGEQNLPPVTDRAYWGRAGGGVGSLWLSYDRVGPNLVGSRAGHGTMAPPMLLSTVGAGTFDGLAGWDARLEAHGKVRLWSDPLCGDLEWPSGGEEPGPAASARPLTAL
jgi:hypothetical protein